MNKNTEKTNFTPEEMKIINEKGAVFDQLFEGNFEFDEDEMSLEGATEEELLILSEIEAVKHVHRSTGLDTSGDLKTMLNTPAGKRVMDFYEKKRIEGII